MQNRFTLRNFIFSYMLIGYILGVVFPEEIKLHLRPSKEAARVYKCPEVEPVPFGGKYYLSTRAGKIISAGYDNITPLGERYFRAKNGLDEVLINACGEVL